MNGTDLPAADTSREYLVLGAGAIGGTLAHALASAGHQITIVDTDLAHVEAIAKTGLVVEYEGGDERVFGVSAYTPDQADVLGLQFDRVLLATKTQHTLAASEWLAPHLDKGGFVISCQNGENVAMIDQMLGRGTAVTSFVNLFADLVGPGRVRYGGQAAFAIGEADGSISQRVLESVADLRAWGPVIATTNVRGYLWSKHIFAEMLSVSALVDAAMADAVDLNRAAFLGVGREVFDIAAAQGIFLEPFDAFRPEAFAPTASDELVKECFDELTSWLRTMPKQRSGVWTDIMVRGRRTEAHEDLRALANVGAEVDVPTPLIGWIDAALTELEEGGRRPCVENLEELERLVQVKEEGLLPGSSRNNEFEVKSRAEVLSLIKIATDAVVREQFEDQTIWTEEDTEDLALMVSQLNDAVEKLRTFDLVNEDEPSFAFRFGDES